jgi:hypothetical protein
MSKNQKTAAFALPVVSLLMIAGGCGVQTPHPNQINAFDGASYDTLTLAHGALTSMRGQIVGNYAKYNTLFNQAAAAYNVALTGYSDFREKAANQAEVAAAISDLTLAIVNLETAFQANMHVAPADVMKSRKKAERVRRAAAGQGIGVFDILTELEVAAAVARAIPAAAPYAGLAQIVIGSTSAALSAEQAAAGQTIDLITIQAIQTI